MTAGTSPVVYSSGQTADGGESPGTTATPRLCSARALPQALVPVHPAVGFGQQRLVGVPVVGKDRRAGTDGDRDEQFRCDLKQQPVDRVLELGPLVLRLLTPAA